MTRGCGVQRPEGTTDKTEKLRDRRIGNTLVTSPASGRGDVVRRNPLNNYRPNPSSRERLTSLSQTSYNQHY
jgi:hypothetical protein